MKKLMSVFLILSCFLMLMGCQKQEAKAGSDTAVSEIDLTKFKNADGDFEYEQIPLRMTYEEAEKELGINDDTPSFDNPAGKTYSLKDRYQYSQRSVDVSLEFHGDTLMMVSMKIHTDQPDALFTEISDSFKTQHGDPALAHDAGMQWKAETSHGRTSLQLDNLSGNVLISYGVLPD